MVWAARFVSAVLAVSVCAGWTTGIKADENPAHEELRALKRNAEGAFNKGDLDGLIKYVDKSVVATWQNGEVTRGHEGVRSYYEKMLTGKQSIVSDLKTEITVDDLAQLYGPDTAVSSGAMAQHFELRDGIVFDLNSRWTATVVKNDGQWKIAAFHVSANLFDNPILAMAVRKTAWWVGGIAAAVGLIIGLVVMQRLSRKKVPVDPR